MVWSELLETGSLYGAVELFDEPADFSGIQQRRFAGLAFGDRGDFPEAKLR